MKKKNKAALIGAMVLMISIVPAFALNDTNNITNGTGDQTQTKAQSHSGNCNQDNGGTCDGAGHKYQHGQNGAKGNCDEQHKYQHGLKDGNTGLKNCTQNCANQ